MTNETKCTQRNERKNKILQLKQLGASYKQIAKELGVSRQRVQQLISPSENDATKIRSNGICEECGKKTTQLHIHHISYWPEQKTKNLCASCHRNAHKGQKNMTISPITIRVYKDDREKLRNLARSSASGLHRVLCEHPKSARGPLAETTVEYPDGRKTLVTVFFCRECKFLAVLDGQYAPDEIGAAERRAK
jgi:predicted transcriptional regulator